MNIDLAALKMIETEKGVSTDVMIEALESAMLSAYKHHDGAKPNASIDINSKTGAVRVLVQEKNADGEVISEFDDTPEDFGRIAASTARQVIAGRLRQVENDKQYGEFATSEGELIAGVVQRDVRANSRGMIVVKLGTPTLNLEGIIPPTEQVPGEKYEHGDRIKCYVTGVNRNYRGISVTLSRTHPGLVRKLFALEVPEIADDSVEIIAVAREAGHRSKIAVSAKIPGINAKGTFIGPMGQRVRSVMNELNGEKIDIIEYSPDPAVYVGNALSPAKTISVQVIDEKAKIVRVVVMDHQLSLAIGKDGQNARLAARLTGKRIDIRSNNDLDSAAVPTIAGERTTLASSTEKPISVSEDTVASEESVPLPTTVHDNSVEE